MDDVTMLKLSPVAESMCLRLHDFEAVSTEGTSLSYLSKDNNVFETRLKRRHAFARFG